MPLRFKPDETQATAPVAKPSHWPRPRLMPYGPRVVRFTKTAKFVIGLFATLSVLTALIGGGAVAKEAQDGRLLAREGRVITGRIESLERRRGEGERYRLHYRFTMNGEVFRGSARIRNPDFETLRRGNPVEVTVLPRDPSVHEYGRVTPGQVDRSAIAGGAVVTLLFGVFGALAWVMSALARRESRILTDWIATSAQVLEAKPTAGSKSGTSYNLRLRFPVPRQADVEVQLRAAKQTKWDVVAGGFTDVLYDPEDPKRVVVRETLTMAEVDPSTY